MSQTCSFGRPPFCSGAPHRPATLAHCGPRLCAHSDRQCSVAQLGRSAFTQSAAALQSTGRRKTASRGLSTRTHALLAVKEATFEAEVLKADKTVLVDFWAPWCGPCRLIEPLLTQIEQETPDLKIVKTDADSCPKLVEQYKVYGLPTLMLFKDGKKVDASHREGAITKPKLLQYLEQHGVVPAAVSS